MRPLQRLADVRDQIVGVFEADRHPQRSRPDAEFGARIVGKVLVRGRRRMGDQALGVAEIVGDLHDVQRVLEAEGRLLAPLRSRQISVEPPSICFLTMSACG